MPRVPAAQGRPAVTWAPLALTLAATVALGVLDPPMRDLQASLARESANRSGVGVTYWFDWFGGVAPGSYSLIVPALTSVTGSLTLLCLCTLAVAALALPLSRSATHPALMTWSVSLAAVFNMLSGRVTFAVGATLATAAALAFHYRRPVPGAVLLTVSGLASPLAPAFAGMVILPFLFFPDHRNRMTWSALAGAAAGVAVPALLFGAPGQQPFPWTTLVWSLVIGAGAAVALTGGPDRTDGEAPPPPVRWIAPLALAAAVVLFVIPTGVGSNISRFFHLVLPCIVMYWSLKSPRVLALLLSPALVYALFVSLYDQVTVADGGDSAALYTPLTEQLDTLVAEGAVTNHRVELVDTDTHAGSNLLTRSVPLARGWENQSDMRYNPVFHEPGALTGSSYRDWLTDNAVAWVAVSSSPIRQQSGEAELIRSGLPYLHEVWANRDWTLYKVAQPSVIVPAPLTLEESGAATMVVDVPRDAVGTDHLLRIRPNRYLTATTGDSAGTRTACLAPTDDGNWTTARFTEPGTYTLTGQFSVTAALEPMTATCGPEESPR